MPTKVGARGWGRTSASAPVAGTNAVQTLTYGGTPTGGTHRIQFEGFKSAAITWSAVNATLLTNINAALDAMVNVGTAGVVATAGTIVAGIGTVILTFSGANLGRKPNSLMVVTDVALTGTTPTAVIADTTPGVEATHRGLPKGAPVVALDTGVIYVNTGTAQSPTFTAVGAQT